MIETGVFLSLLLSLYSGQARFLALLGKTKGGYGRTTGLAKDQKKVLNENRGLGIIKLPRDDKKGLGITI